MNRETLNKQIASVRDGAADLLEQLAGGATKAAESNQPPRRRVEETQGARLADRHAAKMRMAKTMVKTNRRRGRG